MNIAFHFYSQDRSRTYPNDVDVWSCVRHVLCSLRRHCSWDASVVDMFIENLLLQSMAYRKEAISETSSQLIWEPERFQQLRARWLSSLETLWFHFGNRARLERTDLGHLFVVCIYNLSADVAEPMAVDLNRLSCYHSAIEVDLDNSLHRNLYFESLIPRISLLSESEAAILVDAGANEERDASLQALLHRCGFGSIHYEAYLPWDFNHRSRIPDFAGPVPERPDDLLCS